MDIYQILDKLASVENESTRAAMEQLKSLNKIEESPSTVGKYSSYQNIVEGEEVAEKIEPPIKTNPAERGKYAGKTIADLKSELSKVKKQMAGYEERGEKVPSDVRGHFSELTFAIRAKQEGSGKWGSIKEEDMDEGNEFTQALAQARASGAKEFEVDGKKYPVKESVEEIAEGYADFHDKKQMYKKIGADVDGKPSDYTVTFKDGTRKRYQELDGRKRVTTLEPIDRNDAVDDEGEKVKRGRGRPKGTGKKMGARGKTHVREDYDEDEYDEEGEMAKSQSRTIEDAAKELQAMLSDDENLPEWVQKKIALAMEYIDSARDYLKANRPEEDMADEEEIEERELTKGEMKKREEIVKSMKKNKGDFEKRYGDRGEEVMYATATKMAKEDTTAGSVATAPAGSKTKGMFGKGIYESLEKEFSEKLEESMSVNVSADDKGQKNITVTASDNDAEQLSALLKMAGLFGGSGYKSACPTCGQMHEGECMEAVEEDYANTPEEQVKDTEFMTTDIAGGLNAPKTTGQTTTPVINRDPARQGLVREQADAIKNHLETLYKQYKG